MVPQMVDTKLMTRQTYTLYGIEGDFAPKDGKLTFTEQVVKWLALSHLACVGPGRAVLCRKVT